MTRGGRLLPAAVASAFGLMMMVAGMPAARAAIAPAPDPTDMTDGAVRAILRSGDYVYIAGQFTKVRSTPIGTPGPSFASHGIARLDAETGVGDPTWTPDVSWGTYVSAKHPIVWALAAAGGDIWFGGDFGAVDGQPRTNLAAVDAVTGDLDTHVAATVGDLGAQSVRAMAASGDRVFVGGFFTTVNGQKRRRIAAFGLDGSLDPDWKPRLDKRVFSMAVDCTGGSLFVGGQFRRARGTSDATWAPRETVARFDVQTGVLRPWAIPTGTIASGQKAYDLDPTCTQLDVGYGGANYAAAFTLTNGSTGTQLWRTGTTGNVQAIANVGSQVVIGGHFTTIGRVTRNRIAALSMATGALDPAWAPSIEGQWGGPWALLSDGGFLYVGGQFTSVAGHDRDFLARFTVS
jgi:hypothetical protein